MTNDRILTKLDEYLHQNDYTAAERHLRYWQTEAKAAQNAPQELLVTNELMGLYRKLVKKDEALSCVQSALSLIDSQGIGEQVGSATTYLNAATVYKAFGMAEQSLPLFERARRIYEAKLPPSDSRLGGLYNNMALTLVDLRRFSEADALYRRAIGVMEQIENGSLEVAITYLNMASAAEAEHGLLDADEQIGSLLDRAEALLEGHPNQDGYYAFVCEKCASVFGYYGRFWYEAQLKERARRIYDDKCKHSGT